MTAPERDEHGRFKPGGAGKAPEGPFVEMSANDIRAVLLGWLTEAEALEEAGVSAENYEITSYKRRRQQYVNGDTREYTEITAKRRQIPVNGLADYQSLADEIRAWEQKMPPARGPVRGDALVVALADWQIGKGENGGSAASIDRILSAGDAVVERFRELEAVGRAPIEIVVIGLGDLVEGCTGFYANQQFTVDLDQRSQLRTVWRLITALLRKWAPLVPKLTVAPIAGNHGEGRQNGKAITGPSDNQDIAAFEIVRDILAERPDMAHVHFQLPEEDSESLSMAVNAAGVQIGITHGHMMNGGTNASAKAHAWWKGQVFGYGPVSTCKILVSGHFHHFATVEFAKEGRTWFQAPAMDGGSAWFEASSGQSSPPGVLTFLAGKGCGPRGWDHLRVL